jgi:enoyl-CoA hydratase/carnithine racemase
VAGAPVLAEYDGDVGVARLNRADEGNALTAELMEALAETLESFEADDDIHCAVITGDRRVFASGSDGPQGDAGPAPWARLARPGLPSVACVSGYAIGGGWELALACDLIVAGESAEFGQPEIVVGLIPGGGATQRLTRAVGRQRALELVLTGRRITAQEALELGLVNRVTGNRECLERALELAHVVARRPPLAVALAREAVRAAEDLGLAEGLERERRLYDRALATEDRVEGMQALAERRAPRFTGR